MLQGYLTTRDEGDFKETTRKTKEKEQQQGKGVIGETKEQ